MAQINWRLPVCKTAFPSTNYTFNVRTIGPNTTNSQGMIFIAPETGTYTRIAFQATAETIAGASTLRYGFQGITNASVNVPPGIPNGTYISSATVDANTFSIGVAPTITNNYVILSGLNAVLTKGTAYAVVIQPDTNWTAGYTISVRASLGNMAESNSVTHYAMNGATAERSTPAFAVGTATSFYGYPAPFNTPTDHIGSVGTNSQVGMRFTMPSSITSFKVRGWYIYAFRMGFTSDTTATIRIIDSANTTLQSVTYNFNNANSTQFYWQHLFEFTDTLATLTGGTTYYIVIQTGNGSNNNMVGFTINSTFAPAWQTIDHNLVYRNSNTGPWLTTTAPETTLCQYDLILEDVTTGTGGSGTLTAAPRYTINPGIN